LNAVHLIENLLETGGQLFLTAPASLVVGRFPLKQPPHDSAEQGHDDHNRYGSDDK
jgi:hypothetical protein